MSDTKSGLIIPVALFMLEIMTLDLTSRHSEALIQIAMIHLLLKRIK